MNCYTLAEGIMISAKTSKKIKKKSEDFVIYIIVMQKPIVVGI